MDWNTLFAIDSEKLTAVGVALAAEVGAATIFVERIKQLVGLSAQNARRLCWGISFLLAIPTLVVIDPSPVVWTLGLIVATGGPLAHNGASVLAKRVEVNGESKPIA